MRNRAELFNKCLKFSQILLLGVLTITSIGSWSNEVNTDQLNPYFVGKSRAPSSYVANEELEDFPVENIIWLDRTFVEDDAGVLVGMKNKLATWEHIDEYARVWNMKSSGLYNTPEADSRKNYINKMLLKYIDKRISGEIRHAKKGSSWARVGNVQQALKPNTTVKMNKYFKLKIKGKVLEGKVTFTLKNPFFNCETYVWINGRSTIHMGKDFKTVGVKTNLDYKVNEGRWIASIDKKITKQVGAILSAERTGFISLYDQKATQVLKVYFNHPF